MAQTGPIRLLLVDDHPVALEGLAALIARQGDMAVVAEAGNGEDAIALHRQYQPDVTVMDLQMPGVNGVEAIRTIRARSPQARFVVLTTYGGDEDIHRALSAGAQAYLLKDAVRKELIDAIRAVAQGQRYLGPVVASRLAEYHPRTDLTERELEVLNLMATGKRNKEIAGQLGIAEHTVKAHVQNILNKLHADDRTAAVTLALQRGILHL